MKVFYAALLVFTAGALFSGPAGSVPEKAPVGISEAPLSDGLRLRITSSGVAKEIFSEAQKAEKRKGLRKGQRIFFPDYLITYSFALVDQKGVEKQVGFSKLSAFFGKKQLGTPLRSLPILDAVLDGNNLIVVYDLIPWGIHVASVQIPDANANLVDFKKVDFRVSTLTKVDISTAKIHITDSGGNPQNPVVVFNETKADSVAVELVDDKWLFRPSSSNSSDAK